MKPALGAATGKVQQDRACSDGGRKREGEREGGKGMLREENDGEIWRKERKGNQQG